MKVIVIGAGLAGLTCARSLIKLGADVKLIEGSDGVGGRVRSDNLDGFVLDRGFQVLFDSYPAVQRQLNLQALNLSFFAPGAIIAKEGCRTVLSDPRRDLHFPGLLDSAFSTLIPLRDKLKLLTLASKLSKEAGEDALPSDQSIEQYLKAEGFSQQTIDVFFRPFYGGILLDRGLVASSGLFQYYFAMLNQGHASLPQAGIGAVTAQLAEPVISRDSLLLKTRVKNLITKGERVTGVALDTGTELLADAVVLAVDAPSAAALAGLDIPTKGVGVTTLYFAGDVPVWHGPFLVLNANGKALVNNAQLLTNVMASYAPSGKCLLGATVLGIDETPDKQLSDLVLEELRTLFTGDRSALGALVGYQLLRVYRIPYAQPLQLPGQKQPTLPERPGLYFAGDWTASGSINGAMLSGERAAERVMSMEDKNGS